MARFAIRRADGRSNTQVIVDLVAHGTPGTIYSYETIGGALAEGTDRDYGTPAVQAAVRQAAKPLAKVHKRVLQNVPMVGYRVAAAQEHRGLALVREEKSNRQLAMALSTLQHVRWDEMDENTQRAHRAHLMVTEALARNQFALERRMRRAEDAIAKMLRVDVAKAG